MSEASAEHDQVLNELETVRSYSLLAYVFVWIFSFLAAIFGVIAAHYIFRVDFFAVVDVLMAIQACVVVLLMAAVVIVIVLRGYACLKARGKGWARVARLFALLAAYALLIFAPIFAFDLFSVLKETPLAGHAVVYDAVKATISAVLAAPAEILAQTFSVMSKSQIATVLQSIAAVGSLIVAGVGIYRAFPKSRPVRLKA